jgi:ADP-ribose pyrophosphatase YjhB (NUDIX family)
MSAPRLRKAVRAIVLDPADRVLLVKFSFPDRIVWACPGGGIEPGEAEEAAIRRELDEEAGLTGFQIGPCVWIREHVIPLVGGTWDGQAERFYLVRTGVFEPRPRMTSDELAAEYVTELRWWTLDDLEAATERFAPRRLPSLMRALLRDEPAAVPIDVGV